MAIHPWLAAFGKELEPGSASSSSTANAFADLVSANRVPGVTMQAVWETAVSSYVAVELLVEVERPQDLKHPIKAVEPVAVVFPVSGGRPSVLALRPDFPDTPHQNAAPPDMPRSLCIDDRVWSEAKLTYTPMDLVRRIQLWLAKAARGALHDRSLPPEPLYFPNGPIVVLPAAALAADGDQLALVGFMRNDNPTMVITEQLKAGAMRQPAFTVLQYEAQPQGISRMRQTPKTLSGLTDDLAHHGIDLLDKIKAQLRGWAGSGNDNANRLSSRLILLVAFPVVDEQGQRSTDLRAFVTIPTAGQIGEMLGVLLQHKPLAKGPMVYVPAIAAAATQTPIAIEPAQVNVGLDRNTAAQIAGRAQADSRRAVLIGAGSIGSHIASNLAREGVFGWTVVDNDALLPHNFARHALFASDLGAPKASALAGHLARLTGEPCESIVADALEPGQHRDRLEKAFGDANVIIDASASVAVSRHLADLRTPTARRVSAFFNPPGTSVVVLAEAEDRSITLHDLESQYYRFALTASELATHLQPPPQGVRYSGSCRSLTNRIPATRASILGSLAARGIEDSLVYPEASIRVWTMSENGEVAHVARRAAAVHKRQAGWTIIYDDDLLANLARLRSAHLPSETGGVLMGAVDTSRKIVHLAHALPAPADSVATPTGFERGVEGLLAETARISELTMHQLRYVGEWHSHPDRSSVLPSGTDVKQLVWLGSELQDEGVPAIMAIAGQDGRFAIVVSSDACEPATRKG